MAQQIKDFSWNMGRSVRIYQAELQRQVEIAFDRLTASFHLKNKLLYSHNEVLQYLYYSKDYVTIADISKGISQAISNVSVSIRELAENDMIVIHTSESDKRKKLIQLSPIGKQVCDEYVQNDLPQLLSKLQHGISQEMNDCVIAYFTQLEKNIILLKNGLL